MLHAAKGHSGQLATHALHDKELSTHLRCPCCCSCHPAGGSRHCLCLQGYHSRCPTGWCLCCQRSGGQSQLCCLCGGRQLQHPPGHQLQWLWKLSCLMSRLCARHLHRQTGRCVQLREGCVNLHTGSQTPASGSCWFLQQQLSNRQVNTEQQSNPAQDRLLACWQRLHVSSHQAEARQLRRGTRSRAEPAGH